MSQSQPETVLNEHDKLALRLDRFPLQAVCVNGQTFSYRQKGDVKGALNLIFLHGIGSSSASWIKQLEALEGFNLWAWDMPGYGQSDLADGKPVNPDVYADMLKLFIDGLSVDRLILVGHSLGALQATAFAKIFPQYLTGLFLANPAIGYADITTAKRREIVETRVGKLRTLGAVGLAQERAEFLLSSQASKEDINIVRYSMSRLNQQGYRQACEMLVAGQACKDAAHYAGPVYIVSGDQDGITPPESARSLAQAFSNAKFKLITGAGHASYIEKPEELNAALLSYIRDIETPLKGVY